MKKTQIKIAAFIMLTILVLSCKKKESSPNPQPSAPSYTYQLSASINGTPYSQAGCFYTEKLSFLSINNDSTASGTYPRISLQVINGFDTGAYDLTWAGAYGLINVNAQTTVTDAYGTLHVATRTDSVIIGTFSFTGTDSTKVTNGTFTAKKIF